MLIRKYESGSFDILLDAEARELVTYEKDKNLVFDTMNEAMFWDDLVFDSYEGEWYIIDHNKQLIYYIGGMYHMDYLQWFNYWCEKGFVELDPDDDTLAHYYFFNQESGNINHTKKEEDFTHEI